MLSVFNNSGKKAQEQPTLWLFLRLQNIAGQAFPRRARYRWLIICGKTAKTANGRLGGD
jgi:hypothetical protein